MYKVETHSGTMAIHLYDSNDCGLDNLVSLESVKDFLLARHRNWIKLDSQIMTEGSRLLLDERIHLVLYFISPHRLKKLDKEFLLELSDLVPIVPVVAKADTMTVSERKKFLQVIYMHVLQMELENDSQIIYDFGESSVLTFSEENSEVSPTALMCSSFFTSDGVIHFSESLLVDSSSDEIDCELENERKSDEAHPQNRDSDISAQENFIRNEISPSSIENSEICRSKNIFAIITDISGLRKYPWGNVRVDDVRYNDFSFLQR